MPNVNRLTYHYQNVLRQDLLLKCSHSNIMDTPELCNINIVAQVAYDQKLVKQKRLALEIISGQKAVLFLPKATSKLTKNHSGSFRFQSKTNKGAQPKYYVRLCLRKAACSNFLDKLVSIICSTKHLSSTALCAPSRTQASNWGKVRLSSCRFAQATARPVVLSPFGRPLGHLCKRPLGAPSTKETAKPSDLAPSAQRRSGYDTGDRQGRSHILSTDRAVSQKLSGPGDRRRGPYTDQDFQIKIKGNIIELTLASNILRLFPEIQNLVGDKRPMWGSLDRPVSGLVSSQNRGGRPGEKGNASRSRSTSGGTSAPGLGTSTAGLMSSRSFLSVDNLTIQIVTSATNQEETCLVWTGLFQKEIYYDKPN